MKSPEQQAEADATAIVLKYAQEHHAYVWGASAIPYPTEIRSSDKPLVKAIAAALRSKQAELDEAIEALRPMAQLADDVDEPNDCNLLLDDAVITVTNLTVGHCRQAAAIVGHHDKARHAGVKHQLDKSGLAE